ncbi:MAG: hydantoinase/oxoprolinase family protein [Bacteroidota bacterium]
MNAGSKSPEAELVGIDVGGTFTDFVWLREGRLVVQKVSTTPEDQSTGILAGIDALGVSEHAAVVHGTTVATNALLEYRGARTALLTTEGFADVLAIGRQNRPHLYRLGQQRRPSLVPESLRLEAAERVDAEGRVLKPLDVATLDAAVAVLIAEEVESVALVFLFSFLHPAHEREAAAYLRTRLPGIHLSVSSQLLPEYREYERTATTVINAYVQPLVANYLGRLKSALGDRPVRVMQSSGGAIGLEKAAAQAARLVLSGPAGGIVGAFDVARTAMQSEAPQIITFDMGGTSTDVALCPGVLPRTSEGEIAGLPLRFPSTAIHTVGAGGGSIASVDAGGVLRVGPESAGAVPGPACYGRGGALPTVTDANLVLGRLDAAAFLGGTATLSLNLDLARQALKPMADKLNVTIEAAALGIVQVANATMERAVRKVSVEKGYDPRNYTLVPFGGAGPLHACALAEALGMRHILIPRYPGVLSALGLLMADVTYESSQSVLQTYQVLREDLVGLKAGLLALAEQVQQVLVAPGKEEPVLSALLEMRYRGQGYEIEAGFIAAFELTAPLDTLLDDSYVLESLQEAVTSFHALHRQRYGYALEDDRVEVVTLRVVGRQPGARPELPAMSLGAPDASGAMAGNARVWFGAAQPDIVPLYDRNRLQPGNTLSGPTIVCQYDTTLVISGLWRMEVDAHNSIHLWREDDAL